MDNIVKWLKTEFGGLDENAIAVIVQTVEGKFVNKTVLDLKDKEVNEAKKEAEAAKKRKEDRVKDQQNWEQEEQMLLEYLDYHKRKKEAEAAGKEFKEEPKYEMDKDGHIKARREVSTDEEYSSPYVTGRWETEEGSDDFSLRLPTDFNTLLNSGYFEIKNGGREDGE